MPTMTVKPSTYQTVCLISKLDPTVAPLIPSKLYMKNPTRISNINQSMFFKYRFSKLIIFSPRPAWYPTLLPLFHTIIFMERCMKNESRNLSPVPALTKAEEFFHFTDHPASVIQLHQRNRFSQNASSDVPVGE